MADYPLAKFHFQVDWGGTKIGFSEVSGLDVETDIIEYRSGASPEYTPIKQPGLKKYSNITLKRGVFQSDNEFYDWWKETRMFQEGNSTGSIYRRDITISLLNEEHEPIINWKLKRAWASKVQSTDLNASNSETAIETLEITHEGLVIENN
ncbi:MAG: phage tail protein [Bacteroidetes bacterium]|nr:MAG: phage tail protein [Bacteroidota bacterium]